MSTSDSVEARDEPPAVPQNPSAPKAPSRLEAIRERLRALPLRKRLLTLQQFITGVAVSGFALTLVVLVFAQCYNSAVRSAEQAVMSIATQLGTVDAPSSSKVLQPLFHSEGFRSAAIYGSDANLWLKVDSVGPGLPNHLADQSAGIQRGITAIRHVVPITFSPTTNGFLVVEHGLGGAWLRAALSSLVVILTGAVAVLASRSLHRRLYRVVTEPFVELRNVINAIRADSPFALDSIHPKDRQIRRLVKRLGELFRELHNRELLLNEAKLDLELNVLTRTSELQQQVEDRKRAEIALRDSEIRYRNLFENNPMPMFVMDLESMRFMAVNLAAQSHYGYSGKEFASLTLPQLTYVKDAGRVPRAFRQENRSFDAGEWRHVRKNGEEIDVQLTAHTIVFTGKMAMIILANDVTERNRAQRALDEANKKLMITSRQAGMAEVATGVLHNVGNVLNSVNVSASMIAQTIHESKSRGIKKAADLLNANRENLPAFFAPEGKGSVFMEYLAALASQMENERANQLTELELLSRNITHIKKIVAMQQNYAKVGSMLERQSARDVAMEAIQLTSRDLAQHSIRSNVQCADDARFVYTDRHKVLQILVNLISNARQAMCDVPHADRLLSISVTRAPRGAIRFSVKDQGCGIPREHLTRIFNHGFTTKKDGHGFGLHGAAIAARELHGSLSVHSDGPGRGATFTVELPATAHDAKTNGIGDHR